MMLARELDQFGAYIDTRIARLCLDDERSEHPRPGADVDDIFALLWIEQLEHGGNREFAVMLAATFADPPLIPVGYRIPTTNGGLFRWLVPPFHRGAVPSRPVSKDAGVILRSPA